MNHLKFVLLLKICEKYCDLEKKAALKICCDLESKFCWCEGLDICLFGWKLYFYCDLGK